MKKENHYFAWGLTIVLSVFAVLLLYDIVFRSSLILQYFRILMTILAPVLYGFAMAYLLTPLVNWFDRPLTALRKKVGLDKKNFPPAWHRAVSILLAWLAVLAVLFALMRVLLPELIKSVAQLASNAETYYNTVVAWVQGFLEDNPVFAQRAGEVLTQYYREALNWLTDQLMPQFQVALEAITGGVLGVVNFLKNLFVGIIISIYLLAGKERFAAGACKLCYTFLPKPRAALLIKCTRASNRIFINFVGGKLLDSLIIGFLCFFFSSLFRFPYAPLISVVVGVTNVIPFFGPFLGAIPSAFLILLASPIKCLYFVIFILALQQFDGNILGPKILGESTGLSSFWVIVAILVGGGLWGVPGMFLGTPIFACVFAGINAYSRYRLEKKGLPVEVECYVQRRPVWPEEQDPPGKKKK